MFWSSHKYGILCFLRELSPNARRIIAFFATLFGALTISTGFEREDPELFVIAVGILFVIIALVCVTFGRVRQFFGSVIGATLFCLGIAYILDQIAHGSPTSESSSEPSVRNAIRFTSYFGVPGLVYVLRAKFGLGKRNAIEEFKEEEPEEEDCGRSPRGRGATNPPWRVDRKSQSGDWPPRSARQDGLSRGRAGRG